MNTSIAAGFWRWQHWDMDAQSTLAFIEGCLELGVSVFDHAAVYLSEEGFGEALKLKPSLRDDITLISKAGIRPHSPNEFGELSAKSVSHYDSSYDHLIRSVERSLKKLHTDHLDIFLIHRPDYLMRVDEVAKAVDDLTRAGVVNSFGVSNFNQDQLAWLRSVAKIDWHQLEFSVVKNQALDNGSLNQLQRNDIGAMYWSPLAGGEVMQHALLLTAFETLAEKYSIAPQSVPYAWLNTYPLAGLQITGSSRLSRIAHAVEGSKVMLSHDDWYRLLEIAREVSVP